MAGFLFVRTAGSSDTRLGLYGGPGWDRTDDLFHAMEHQKKPFVDGKRLTGRRDGKKSAKTARLAPKNLTSGQWADSWGISP
jgi:hypothetical protein